MKNRLYKREKLCSKIAIDRLFGKGTEGTCRALSYPLRAVWRHDGFREGEETFARFLIMVPKKRLRHAVDRVAMRRKIRESYRLNKSLLTERCDHSDIAFVYVGQELLPYQDVERAMKKLLVKIEDSADKRP